ncbi:hypothetical protein [Bacillus cereus]|nr:hypothetical protein [Bacillus cereus]HDR8324061.1 hypothetical protein [Bacillus cereus]HDR8331000.1 hypothetical protein [Bacillus cereus]HDR8336581.1 hypothetical protein [Bacillus cereus]
MKGISESLIEDIILAKEYGERLEKVVKGENETLKVDDVNELFALVNKNKESGK